MTSQLAKAEILIGDDRIEVQFNPVSLQVEITNSTSPQGQGGGTNQISTLSSAKLGLDLTFDTTSTGEDVRNKTRPLRAAVRAPQDNAGGGAGSGAADAGAAFVPPRVTFQWGTFSFAGITDSHRETLDFFSSDGVPLRAQVVMSLKEQPNEFAALERPLPSNAANPTAFEVPAEMQGLSGAAGVARLGGDLRAARAIAGANGEQSLRFGVGATLAVSGGVQLRGAVAFSASGTAGATARSSAPALRFDARKLATRPVGRQLATDAGAAFAIDGRALPQSEAGLRSDVGQNRSLTARLRFDN